MNGALHHIFHRSLVPWGCYSGSRVKIVELVSGKIKVALFAGLVFKVLHWIVSPDIPISDRTELRIRISVKVILFDRPPNEPDVLCEAVTAP